MLGVFLEAWVYRVGSPLAPAIIVVLLALEPQFNNILYRSPREFEALGLLPLDWKQVILVKNIAAVILTVLFIVLASGALLYFSPDHVNATHLADAIVYLASIIFPLLHFGNDRSVKHPRRISGLQLEDLVQATWMVINIVLVSIPYYLFATLLSMPYLCLIFALASGWYWYRHSISSTAARLQKEFSVLCQTA